MKLNITTAETTKASENKAYALFFVKESVQFSKILSAKGESQVETVLKGMKDGPFEDLEFLEIDGCNTLYGETQGNYAKAALALKLTVGQCVAVQTTSSARSYTTKDGEQRWENRVTITNIAPFGPRRKAEGGQTS